MLPRLVDDFFFGDEVSDGFVTEFDIMILLCGHVEFEVVDNYPFHTWVFRVIVTVVLIVLVKADLYVVLDNPADDGIVSFFVNVMLN